MNNMDTSTALDAVAIIGMAGRFPGARTLEEFWRNLCNGVESISSFTDAELLASGIDQATINSYGYMKSRAILDDVELFDASFFNYTPREAEIIDPQQRVFLECAWESLEHAGYDPETYQKRIGVYAGSSMNSYVLSNLYANRERLRLVNPFQITISNEKDFLSTRLSYKLNLKGPSLTVQTACSTSLVAVHLACQSLLNGECDMALAGGVSITIPQKMGAFYQEGGIISPDGHCRAFDAKAQGTVYGEGSGVVVLKRLEDALADGDTIHALIKGSAINNDGAGKIGYTAPGIDGQAAVIAEAQAIAGVDPETITYIEAHGTGTQLGDPIEIAALQKVFRAHPNKTGYCAIGSLKTNIGHLDAAAGVASLIKTVLALKHRLLPPSLHYEQPNPAIDFAHSPFFVNASLRTWQSTTGPLRAGVSSFGIGGTNAHMILEEAPPSEASTQTRPQQVLLLSAKTEKALEHTTTRLVEHLRQHPDLNLADVAHTLQVGRRRFPYRRLLVCKSTDEAIGMLAALDPHHVTTAHQESEKQPVVFLFPGQGAQHVAMAQELYQLEPLFRAQVDRCAQLLIPHLGLDLRSLIYPDAGTSTDGQLEQTAITQPVLFTIEYALAKLWMAWGIHPQAMIGHSIGEYVAACLAGVFSLEEALALVAERGRMMQLLPKGAMLTVPLSEQELAPLLNSRISLAVTNGPGRSVVAGPVDAIDTLEQRLIQQNVVCRRLHTSHAFHSWMMDAIISPFMDRVKKVRLRAPTIPYISNVTGNWITAEEATDPAYWAKHLRNTVRFSEGIQTLLQKPQRLLLEVGPGQTLSSLVKQHPASSKEQILLSSLPPVQSQDSDMRCLLATLGKLWLEGVHINWSAFSTGRRIPLPTYPFERKRYWIEPATSTDTLNADKYQHGDARKEQISNEGQFSSLPPEKDASMPEQSIMTTRLQKILLPLREIFASLFAIDLAEIDDHMTFLEMGADSLFFLQASQIIQNTFGVQVPFRLLLEEYSTIEALALYVAEKLPPETYQEEPPLPLPTTPQPPAPQVALQPVAAEQGYTASVASMQSTDNTTIERIIGQQLQTMSQIMAQQLELLRNGHTAALAPPPSGNGKIPASATSTVTTLTPMAQPAQIPSASAQPASRKELAAEAPSLRVDPETFVPYRSSPKKVSANLTARQQQSIDALTERLTRRTGKSKALAQTYRPVLADSRGTAIFSTVLKELAYPLVVERATGSHVWDIDGNEYVDIAMGFGALLFGHSPSFLMEAMAEQSRRGIRLGLQSDSVGQVASLICELTGTQRVAFCNSGTEAVMTALRLARTITGRPKIALFAGAYHGSFDGVLVRAQDIQGRPQTTALSPGIPPHMIEDVMAVYFGEPETFDLLAAHAHELAAILIELPQSRRLDLHPKAFLQQLRQFTQEKGIALILDEVITGFRVHPGGVQALFDIQADLVTYGKTVGGGLPVGLIAGKAEYMDAIDGGSWNYGDTSYPQAVQTFFAGTYFKHPYIMPAVLAIMQQIKRNGPSLQQQLDLRTEQLVKRLNDYFEQEHVPIFTTRFSSLFRFVFPPRLKAVEANLFFYYLLDQGVYVSETRSCFLSTAHTDEDIEAIVTAVKAAVTAMRAGGFLLDTPDPPDDTPPRKVQMLPLTEAQKELWFMAQLGDDSSRAYNEAISLHFHGPFQVQAMQRSWRELTQRHESLRTTFNAEGDCQRIAPEMTLDISLRDFSTTRGSEQEAQIFRWQAEETQRPFDLERGPLLRVSILKLAEQHHLLTIIYHHIIIDGWSVGTLLHELSTLYSAYCQGIAYQLPQPTQYSQYVRWQAEQEQSTDEKYWLAQFVAPVPALNLPTDHPRPAIKTYAGARQSIVLDGSLYNALKTLGVQQNCTLFTTLLAGFQLLLHRLTGQNDLVTAIPAAGQLAMGSTHLIGHCVNFLPLRSRISHPLTLTDYLTQVRQIVLDAHSHQNYPFHKLVKRLKLARDPGQLPLTNIMFNLDYAGAPELFALTASMATNPTGYTKFDLSLNIVQSSRELLVECDYNTDLFEAQTIQNWLAYFQTLLKGMTAQPEQNVLALPLLTEVDRHRLLIEWNATQQAYPAERCLHHLIEEQAAQTPDKIALVFEDMYLTYHTLNTCANQLAHYLQRLSIRAEMRVGISMHRSASLLIGLLGILKAGCAYVPLDPLYPQERLAFMLADAQVAVLLTQASLSATVPQHNAQIVCLDSDWSTIARESTEAAPSLVYPDHLAYVIYTSGSTGTPKGVQIAHRSVVNFLASIRQQPGLQPQDSLLAITTLSFDIAALELFLPLTVGACVNLLSREIAVDGTRLAEQIAMSGATVMQATPTGWRLLLDAGWQGSPDLRILCGGEALSAELANRLLAKGACLWNLYGPTETTIWSTLHLVLAEQKGIPIGRPIANTQVYLLDPRLQPVPPGIPGEVYIGGLGVARGYLNRPDLTAERFMPNPFSPEPGMRMYRTGDMARYLHNGTIEYLGRTDYQVKLRGYRIELEEIETLLAQHPAVRQSLALVREDTPGIRRLVAYLIPQTHTMITISELRHYLKERLPEYMLPAYFVIMEAFPLTDNGKVNRRMLPPPDSTLSSQQAAFEPANTPNEKILAGIWTQVLGSQHISMHDNFFELGGDSILCAQVVVKANKAGIHITPQQMFQYQTIADLVTILDNVSTPQREPEGDLVPLTPIQYWFFEQQLPEPQHWNQAMLLETRHPLDPASLEKAGQALLQQHDALRLRAKQDKHDWQLFNAGGSEPLAFSFIDLSTQDEPQQAATIKATADSLQASLNLSTGPLMRLAYFNIGHQTGRLLIIIHHLAVDIISWRILLDDLQLAYQQSSRRETIRLPVRTTSFKQWAERLTQYAQTTAVRQELAYWLTMLKEPTSRLPIDHVEGRSANTEVSARTISVSLTATETQILLQELPRTRHVQITEVLLTALALAVTQWTGGNTLLVDVEGHGREMIFEDVDLSRTVGWFTTFVPLLFKLDTDREPDDALTAIKEQFRHMPNGGIGYSLLRYLCEDQATVEQLRNTPRAEIVFNYQKQAAQALTDDALFTTARESAGAIRSPRGKRSHLLEVEGIIARDRLHLHWTYSEQIHQRPTIERLAASYMAVLRALIVRCQALPAKIYPLSPMQQGILFHSLYTPQSGVYIEQLSCTLRGPLQVTAFQQAWQRVVNHYQILRTAFLWEGYHHPLQEVCQNVDVPWHVADWRELSPDEQQERLSTHLRDDRTQGFDLTQAPLMRMTLMQLAEERYHFIWSFHHLLLDGWSISLVLKDVFALYEASIQEKTSQPAHHPSYSEYIDWVQQQDISQAEAFWRRKLQGFTAPTPLNASVRKNAEGASGHHEQQIWLSEKFTSDLQSLVRQHRLTLNTLIQGAWALLLSHYSGEDDILFGAVVSGRPVELTDAAEMVGLFINTLPVRVQIPANTRLLSWLQALQLELIEARRYEYSPLSQVQKWSDVPRGLPLFQSILAFENYPFASSQSEANGGLEVHDLQILEQVDYPLTMAVMPARELLLRISYDRQQFDSATITRMLGHYQALLEAILANPEQPLTHYSLLTKAEQQQILVEWNDTQTIYPQAACIHQLFEEQVARTPDALACTSTTCSLTYDALNLCANQLAYHLRARGIKPEMPVGLCLENKAELVIGMLSIYKAGGAYVPLDPQYPEERLTFMLQDAQVQIVLTQQKLLSRLPLDQAQAICLDTDWPLICQQSKENIAITVIPENLAYIIFTSGSTGRPKGVQLTHRGIANLIAAQQRTFHVHAESRIIQFASLSFDASIFETLMALLMGAVLVQERQENLLPGPDLLRVLRDQAVTIATLPPSALAVLPFTNLPALDTIIVAGEACPMELVTRWAPGRSFFNAYGPTEATIWSSVAQCYAEDQQKPLIGRPISNTQLYVLDKYMSPVPAGIAGELYIGSIGLARGYLQQPALTAERFVPHPFVETSHNESGSYSASEPGARLYRTGDQVRYHHDGSLEFLGRLDHQVKIRGFRIELGEIETILRQHPALQDVVVLTRSDSPGEKRLVAYVVFHTGQQVTTSDLRDYLRTKLPDYMLPSTFVALKTLPLTASGKVDRRALPAPDSSRPSLKEVFVAPRTSLETTLAAIWMRVLGLAQVGVFDSFFELGGDSILCFQIVAQAHQSGLHITPKHIFDHPTIAQLAEVTSTLEGVYTEQGLITGQVPLTPIQRWFFEQQLPEPQHWNQSLVLRAEQTLDPILLRQAVTALLRHHDSLRSRFIYKESRWEQFIAGDEEPASLTIIDLSGLDTPAQRAAAESTATRLQASLNLSEGPLWRTALFKLGTDQADRLLLIAHHLIIDGVSWRILLEDLHTACQQLQRRLPIELPPKTVSFKHWSHSLQQYAQSSMLQQEAAYWREIARASAVPLPLDFPDGRNTEADARTATVSLSEHETQALLQEIPRICHTQINEVLLTALFATWQQWTGTQQLLVDMESHGREAPFSTDDLETDLSRTVGWFTALFPVHLAVEKAAIEQGPVEILKAVKEQVRSIPHRGIGYGVLRYLCPDENIAARLRELPSPQISFNYLGQFDQNARTTALLTIAPENYGIERSERGERSHTIEINGLVADKQLHMHWTYSKQLHRQATIERLAHGFIDAIRQLIEQAQSLETAVYTPSDFPETQLSQEELDFFLAGLDSSGE